MVRFILALGLVISVTLNLWLIFPYNHTHNHYQIKTLEMLENTMSAADDAVLPWDTFSNIMNGRVLAFSHDQSPVFIEVSLNHYPAAKVVLVEFSWMESPVGILPDAIQIINSAGDSLETLTDSHFSRTSEQLIRSGYLEVSEEAFNNAVGILLLSDGKIMDYCQIKIPLNEIEVESVDMPKSKSDN